MTEAIVRAQFRRDDKTAGNLRAKAKVALAEGKHEEALEFIGQAMELKPSSFKLLRLRSMAYACLHKYPKSLADAEKLIALQSTSTDGYYHKGFALYQMQDYSGAAHAFRHGLKLNPTDKVLHQGFWDSLTLLSQHRVKNPYKDGLFPQ